MLKISVLPEKPANGVRQSTITHHFITNKAIAQGDCEIRRKPNPAPSQLSNESTITIDSPPAKRGKRGLQFSEEHHTDLSGICSDGGQEAQIVSDSCDDDVQLSQCCTQPLGNFDTFCEDPREISKSYANTNEAKIPWLHSQRSITGQKSIRWHDSVHGSFEIPELCEEIMNTAQFQVLQQRKQLGVTHLAMRNATHSRFEHSVGVMHLAERLVKTLQEQLCKANMERQRRKQIGCPTDESFDGWNGDIPEVTGADLLCVMVAGLCHDLGHGPFSHAFETVAQKLAPKEKGEWSHEENSLEVLRYLLKENNIDLAKYGLDPVKDLEFIEEMIASEHAHQGPRRGRGADKAFLYEVVCCAGSGFDVDKLDYLVRDSRQVLGETVNINAFLDTARVCACFDKEGGPSRLGLAWSREDAWQASEIFRVRFLNHLKMYTHSNVMRAERMVQDLLLSVAQHVTLSVLDSEGRILRRVTLAEAAFDPAAFALLDDGVLGLACQLASPADAEGVVRARALMARLSRRRLYDMVGVFPVDMTVEDLAWLRAAKAARRAGQSPQQPPSRAASVWDMSDEAITGQIAAEAGALGMRV
mmetsp:Transcript_40374/g.108346  ORF Transcript_40374/g.108346 Transcript_40374/m.108346 type:complete len:587 (-) Transcript_40374:445-2205(-)